MEASMEDMENMKASTDVPSTGASTKSSTIISIEGNSTGASMEAFMVVMEAFVEVMEAFIDVTSTEFFMESAV